MYLFIAPAWLPIKWKYKCEFELLSIVIGYKEDSPILRKLRQHQVAWLGPAGYVALEDSEAGALIHKAIKGQDKEHSYLGYGGHGKIKRGILNNIQIQRLKRLWNFI